MSHRFIRLAGLLSLAALLAGCLNRAPAFPAYGTMEEALGEVLGQRVSIAYQEPFDQKRAMLLFRTNKHPGLSPTLLERTGFGKWRMTGGVGLGGPRSRVGALSYDRGSLGHAEEQHGTVTHVKAEAHVVFGEVLDPAITWVELTLYDEGAQPILATVRNGVWLVRLPPEKQNTWFDLRAGDANGRRFAASVGRGSIERWDMDPATAPLVEYQDVQQGIRLEHPTIAHPPRIDREGRLLIAFSAWTITVERKAHPSGEGLAALLRGAVATGGERVLEHGIRPLGSHQAGYLLESRPEPDGKHSTYHARYLVLADRSQYEVTCATSHVYSRLFWEEHLKPVCDRVLTTVRLGDM